MAQFETFQKWQADAVAVLSRLTPRERNLVLAISGAVVVGIVFLVGHSLSNAVDRRLAHIAAKTQDLEKVAQLTAGYAQAERERNELERKLAAGNTRLITVIGEVGKRLNVDIGGMSDKGVQPLGDGKISESSVEISLLHIDLDKLTKFLTAVEQGSGIVKIKRIQLRPREAEQVVDAYLTIATYQVAS